MSTDYVTPAEPRPLDLLASALAAFQAEMPTVPKSHTATVKSDKGSYSYTYAGLADVSEAAMPLLAKHGLSFTTLPGQGILTGMLLHKSGQHLTASLPVTGGTPQAIGSSLTYGRRYLLGCMTGLVTDDDEDGQLAQSTPRGAKAPAPEAPPVERNLQRSPRQSPTDGGPISAKTRNHMFALFAEFGLDETQQKVGIGTVLNFGGPIASRADLTEDQGRIVVAALEKRKAAQTPAGEHELPDPTSEPGWGGGNG